MNNSSLFECTIPPRNEKTEYIFYTVFKIIKIFFFILAFLCALYAFIFSNFMWIVTAILIILGLVFLNIQCKFYNFYDYTFCEDEIRITRVVNNKGRRFLIKFKIKNIEKIGFVSSNNYQKLILNKTNKRIYGKSKLLEINNLYFVVNLNGEKKIVILSFNKKFLAGVLQRISSKVYDDEFTNQLKEYEKYNLS